MKIAFWSEEEHIGTTFNLAAVACTAALISHASAAVISGGYQDESFEKHFTAERGQEAKEPSELLWTQLAAEKEEYFASRGIDFLLGKEKEELTGPMLKANMSQIVKDCLYCMPCGKRQYQDWWNTGLLFDKMAGVTEALEENFDLVFLDCGARKDDFSRKMLQEAEICVLNMSQESELIGEYFRSRPKLKGKIFFLVGNYFEDEVYNRANLVRIYRIEEEILGAVPYNAQLQAAGTLGKTGKFMSGRMDYGSGGAEMNFGKELLRTTRLILKLAGIIQ